MELFGNETPVELYGRWNALAAFGADESELGICEAHDGDFFPESPLDYVEAMRRSIVSGDLELTNLLSPIRADIDITQSCNAKCKFCFSRVYQRQFYRRQRVNSNLLATTLRAMAEHGLKSVRYCGGGEPLVHPNIREFLRLPRTLELNLCLISNLDFLDKELSSIIYDTVDHLRWSVNAATDATRIAIHRPGSGANLLSETARIIAEMISQREADRGRGRRPMVWSTYLVIPENVHEITSATRMMKSIGVDSISFRPVHHGLDGTWDTAKLEELSECLQEARAIAEPPRFHVYTPKRHIVSESVLNPNNFFSECIARRFRIVLEATASGMAIQGCGEYRGTSTEASPIISESNPFQSIWPLTGEHIAPKNAPIDCPKCIAVSINRTLGFIYEVLLRDPTAKFRRAKASLSRFA